jgi:hypothetical protein
MQAAGRPCRSMRYLSVLILLTSLLAACGGGSSSPTSPSTTAATTTSTTTATTSTTATSSGGTSTTTASECRTFGNGSVSLSRRSSVGAFTHAPFNAADLSIITNGAETNDPRFTYQWIRNRGSAINIYAPADGVLVRIRHKTPNAQFASEDYDLFFLVACEPGRYLERDAIVRFNHITDPRADIRAAYRAGSLPSQEIGTEIVEYEDRQVPTSYIRVVAGELLGSTRGTPTANNFDFSIAVDDVTLCPFSALNEPHKSALLGLLGPQSATPTGPPVAGYPCQGFGRKP